MSQPHALDTRLPDLLRAGGASQLAISGLTPAAATATKGHLLHLWLQGDPQAHQHFGKPANELPDSSGLTQRDINSILVAFENAYASSAGIGPATAATAPSGFFCGWFCCCCCPCCCSAAADAAPAPAVI